MKISMVLYQDKYRNGSKLEERRNFSESLRILQHQYLVNADIQILVKNSTFKALFEESIKL